MFKNLFEGWYFKHQNDKQTLAVIPGISNSNAFIQVITDKRSFHITFPKSQFRKSNYIRIANNIFSTKGIKLNIKYKDVIIKGKILYHSLIPLSYDIMGPFRFFPMSCRHGIISMYHKLKGWIEINGDTFDFNNGTGYIETDRGYSFPKNYTWLHSNDFNEKCSIMAAIADVPMGIFHFQGLICGILYNNKEYRIATYNGGKILKCAKDKIIIYNKNLRLEVDIRKNKGLNLKAPICGSMTRIIKESPSCCAHFNFFEKNKLVFEKSSSKTSFEFVPN